MRIKLTNKE